MFTCLLSTCSHSDRIHTHRKQHMHFTGQWSVHPQTQRTYFQPLLNIKHMVMRVSHNIVIITLPSRLVDLVNIYIYMVFIRMHRIYMQVSCETYHHHRCCCIRTVARQRKCIENGPYRETFTYSTDKCIPMQEPNERHPYSTIQRQNHR